MPDYPRLDAIGLEHYTEQMKNQIDDAALTIKNSSGTDMPDEEALQFDGMNVTNDSTNGKNIVHGQFKVSPTRAHWDSLTYAEKNDPNTYWVRLWADSSNFVSDKTPVGTILSMTANSSVVVDPFPTEDYLLCGGGTKNIADYPKLAQYFEDAYGSVNYFGGDGITTFGIPNFSADYPTNGVLVIKAKITEHTMAVGDLDDTQTTTHNVWSAYKVNSEISPLKTSLNNRTFSTPDTYHGRSTISGGYCRHGTCINVQSVITSNRSSQTIPANGSLVLSQTWPIPSISNVYLNCTSAVYSYGLKFCITTDGSGAIFNETSEDITIVQDDEFIINGSYIGSS